MYVYMYVCMYVHYECMFACMYVCMYVCKYVNYMSLKQWEKSTDELLLFYCIACAAASSCNSSHRNFLCIISRALCVNFVCIAVATRMYACEAALLLIKISRIQRVKAMFCIANVRTLLMIAMVSILACWNTYTLVYTFLKKRVLEHY